MAGKGRKAFFFIGRPDPNKVEKITEQVGRLKSTSLYGLLFWENASSAIHPSRDNVNNIL